MRNKMAKIIVAYNFYNNKFKQTELRELEFVEIDKGFLAKKRDFNKWVNNCPDISTTSYEQN